MNRTILLLIAGTLSLWGCSNPEPADLDEPGAGGMGGTGGMGEDPDDDDGDDDGDDGEPGQGDGHGGGGEPPDDPPPDAGSGEGGEECIPNEETHWLEATPASVMLVLDKSGSMDWTWDDDENPDTAEVTKWSSLHGAVQTILEGFAHKMAFGAQLFPQDIVPSGFEEACLIDPLSPEVPVSLYNTADILAGIPAPDQRVYGGTPASAGFASAAYHLMGLPEDSPRHIILVTDGAANCKDGEEGENLNTVYDDTLPYRVAAAREEQKIFTHAIGVDMVNEEIPIPATNPWESLNEVALAGGVPKAGPDAFWNVTSGIELLEAMNTITANIECTVTLDAPIELPDTTSVAVNGANVQWVDDCATQNGWTFTTAEPPFDAVQLCGTVCDPDLDDSEVQVTHGCP